MEGAGRTPTRALCEILVAAEGRAEEHLRTGVLILYLHASINSMIFCRSMAYWLLKSEPDVYSYDDLVRDKKTEWDGVNNNTALMHIRAMNKGDLALIYHTGEERAAIGIAEIISQPHADPKLDDPKRVVMTIKPKKKLKHPVTLPQIKADPAFAGWDLLRIGRLSVVPVPEKMWKRILELSETSPESAGE